MPVAICHHCNNPFEWHWEEAFAKWGFDAGTGQIQTDTIAEFLIRVGYEVTTRSLGACNTVIVSLKKDGKEHIPAGIRIGYVHPRRYLPHSVTELLDRKFPSQEPYDAL